ncbi:MAG: DUF3035 domain-containing protein [Acetobacteraceae bacterium]|nr:DUF3035 domain-containing protein [Acetobacteraceae bacterium]
MKLRLPFVLVASSAAMLAGCSETGVRHFGTTRDGASELRASAPPPLSVPPSLVDRPRRAGAPADEPAAAGSESASGEAAPVSAGQDAIIEAAGPSAPADIRRRVDQDQQIRNHDEEFTDRLLFGQPDGQAGSQEPLIQSGSKSWLGSIF